MDIAERILRQCGSIAVVGASREPEKPAHYVPAQLKAAGFRIVPVNPYAPTLFGDPAYRSLGEIPFAVEVVLVFRPSAEAADVARQAVAIGAKALWLQLGIRSDIAQRIAHDAGLLYVEDSCAAVVRSKHRIQKLTPS